MFCIIIVTGRRLVVKKYIMIVVVLLCVRVRRWEEVFCGVCERVRQPNGIFVGMYHLMLKQSKIYALPFFEQSTNFWLFEKTFCSKICSEKKIFFFRTKFRTLFFFRTLFPKLMIFTNILDSFSEHFSIVIENFEMSYIITTEIRR